MHVLTAVNKRVLCCSTGPQPYVVYAVANFTWHNEIATGEAVNPKNSKLYNNRARAGTGTLRAVDG